MFPVLSTSLGAAALTRKREKEEMRSGNSVKQGEMGCSAVEVGGKAMDLVDPMQQSIEGFPQVNTLPNPLFFAF
jgi:hypothetical protein